MTNMGRQMQQTGASFYNQQSGDNLHIKMMQSGNHYYSASGALQDNTIFAIQSGPGQRMFRSSRSVNSGSELLSDIPTSPVYGRSSSIPHVEPKLPPTDLSPGIFDVHNTDAELLPEASLLGLRDGTPPFLDSAFESDIDLFSANKQPNQSKVPFDTSPLRSSVNDKAGASAKIKVVVRKRPLNKKEISKKEEDIITIEPNGMALTVHETKLKVDLTAYVEKHEFVFDAVLDDHVSNEEVYRVTVEPIVPAIFQKTKATCFAYGQTGSGKTFTMQPLPLKASQDILRLMDQVYMKQGYQLCVSFFEIYGGKLYDLLSDRRKLCMREDGKQQVCIVGLQEFRVSNVQTIKELIEKGNSARSTGTTGANEESSRSHAILQLVIKKSVEGNETKPPRLVGKLSFIDLAGSERGADTTDNDRQTRMEGAEINKSLLALKECIRALDNDQVHIPFRGSKLTEVLRDSFVGNSRTVMISCISPIAGSCEHTLNTLRYADRVKSLSKNGNAKKDAVSSTAALRESSAAPLPTLVPSMAAQHSYESSNFDGYNRYGLNKQLDGEYFQNYTTDSGPPSGRRDDPHLASVFTDTRDNNDIISNGYENCYSQNPKEETKVDNIADVDKKHHTVSMPNVYNLFSGDVIDLDNEIYETENELNAICKEEEDLVSAHRKQVEETIDLVKEEMQLLLDIDKAGYPVEGYICKLGDILAQKAEGILDLQNKLSHFHRVLSDRNILAPSAPSKQT